MVWHGSSRSKFVGFKEFADRRAHQARIATSRAPISYLGSLLVSLYRKELQVLWLLFLCQAIMTSQGARFHNRDLQSRFTSAFSTSPTIKARGSLGSLNSGIIRLFTNLEQRRHAFNTTLPTIFSTTYPRLTPQHLFIQTTPQATSFTRFTTISTGGPTNHSFKVRGWHSLL